MTIQRSRSDEKSPELATTGGVMGALVIRSMDDLARLSGMLASSGYFKDARDAAQAGVKVLAGLEMGFGAFASMTGIHLIDGKPSVGANLLAQAVKRSGRYNYRVTTHTDQECVIAFYEAGEKIGESSFSMKDAQAAGVAGRGPWKAYPKAMLFARALSQGVRWHCPDVLGGTTAYVPEELGASVDGDGNVITVESRPVQPAAEPRPASPSFDDLVALEENPWEKPAKAEAPADDAQFPPEPPEGLFPDEKPKGNGNGTKLLTSAEAGRLHKKLGAVGLPKDQHYAFASAVLGAEVTSLTLLSREQSLEVNAMADRLAKGEVEWRGGELVLPPEEDAA